MKFVPNKKIYFGGDLGSFSGKNNHYSIGDSIRDFVSRKSFAVARLAAAIMSDNLSHRPRRLGWHNVTGNLANSIGISVVRFNKGRSGGDVIDFSPFSGRPATRASLRKGEAYDLDEYWMGDKVEGKPFIGAVGRGGQYGDILRKRYAENIDKAKFTKSYNDVFFQIFAYVSMPYTKFVFAKRNVELMDEIFRDSGNAIKQATSALGK